jgi:uncharacterized protein
MINSFPHFTPLTLEQGKIIAEYTSHFAPYSDFDFVSLYAWNTDDTTEVTLLNENLVITLPDYITGEPVISMLGTNKLAESMVTLLGTNKTIKLIPEDVVVNLGSYNDFEISEDPDNYDYIYDLEQHATLSGKSFKRKRNKLNSFIANNKERVSVQPIDFHSKSHLITELFDNWVIERSKDDEEARNEQKALTRLIDNHENFDIVCYVTHYDDKPVAFSINELLPNNYAICHFQKSSYKIIDLDIFMTNYAAKELLNLGCKFINWEQDLGIPGLRTLKEGYKPVKLLKKYKVTGRSGS